MANGNSHQDLNSIHVSFIWSITKETSNHFHLMLFYCFNTTSENWKSIGIYLLFLQPAHFRIQAHEIIAPIESKWYSYNSTNLRKIWILFLIGYSWYSTKGKSLNGWKKGWKNSQGKAWDFYLGFKRTVFKSRFTIPTDRRVFINIFKSYWLFHFLIYRANYVHRFSCTPHLKSIWNIMYLEHGRVKITQFKVGY